MGVILAAGTTVLERDNFQLPGNNFWVKKVNFKLCISFPGGYSTSKINASHTKRYQKVYNMMQSLTFLREIVLNRKKTISW